MDSVTTKQLKQRTGEVIRRVRSGERLTITYRGKPVAVIAPPATGTMDASRNLRTFEEAREDIEQTLARTRPRFTDWREATEWV